MKNETKDKEHRGNRASSLAQGPFRVLGLFQEFAHAQASSGIVLLACVIVAIVWANSPFGSSYYDLWHLHFAVRIGDVDWIRCI